MVKTLRRHRRRAVAATAVLGGLALASPAAARYVVIDVAGQSNPLAACGAFAGCQQLLLASQNTSVAPIINISPTGFIEFMDGRGGAARFSVGASSTAYQVLSGYTISASLGRIDFISFYAPGASTAVLPTGNRPAVDFQIQFRTIAAAGTPSAFLNGLEIAYAYNDPLPGGGNRVESGAEIGYSGATLGLQPGTAFTFAGQPAKNLVTNTGGLLLGGQATDSDFAFVLRNYPDPSFRTVVGLSSETFAPRYAATAPVPEPATWAMLLFGFGALGAGLRRRKVAAIA